MPRKMGWSAISPVYSPNPTQPIYPAPEANDKEVEPRGLSILVHDQIEGENEEEDATVMKGIKERLTLVTGVASSRIVSMRRIGRKGGLKKNGATKARPVRVQLESHDAWMAIIRKRHEMKMDTANPLPISENLTMEEMRMKALRWPIFMDLAKQKFWVQWRGDQIFYRSPKDDPSPIVPRWTQHQGALFVNA
jgi:hypothetical protein